MGCAGAASERRPAHLTGPPGAEEAVRMEGTPWCWFDFLLKKKNRLFKSLPENE